MEETKFEIERIIRVNIIEDSKQKRIAIPAEIVEDFGINPEMYQFAWIVQKQAGTNQITIVGKFVSKENEKKE